MRVAALGAKRRRVARSVDADLRVCGRHMIWIAPLQRRLATAARL